MQMYQAETILKPQHRGNAIPRTSAR
jgi:hypothetical protein